MIDSRILSGKNVLVQGITGTQGQFHTQRMLDYGTNIVAGTSPKTSGEVHDVPVYQTIKQAQTQHQIDASIILVPAPHALGAILEALDAKVPLIIVITEHIPVHDMLTVHSRLRHSDSVLIGPNCPGVLVPGRQLLGIIPADLAAPGDTAIISRSGTLTYEAMDLLTKAGIGQRYIIGIGGDMVRGSGYVDWLESFQHDDSVRQIVMIGEIGGTDEIDAAEYIKSDITKPVFAYIAGHSAPTGKQMGHAGAILGTNQLESAAAKTKYLATSGAVTANSIAELVSKMVQLEDYGK